MRYLSHFVAIFVAVAGVWLFLLLAAWLFGFDNVIWLAAAALFGVAGPLVALIGGVFTAFRRRRYDTLGVGPAIRDDLFPLMYYRGTFSADGSKAYRKPPTRIEDCFTVALPGADCFVLSRANKSLCMKPGQPQQVWLELGKELAVLPRELLRDVSVELFDVAALDANRVADRIGDAAGSLVGMALGGGTSKTIHFSAMIVLHYLHKPAGRLGRRGGNDGNKSELRQMLFAFTQEHGAAPVRAHLESALERAGVKAGDVLGGRHSEVSDPSQQAALLAARLLRQGCGG
ncbi:MAG: hypothetical protein LAT61_15565 [Alcanivorax sp.]|nr:hypothetical protein [Alcanivorax sp.]